MKNLKVKLTAALIAIIMTATPLALTGCSYDSSSIITEDESKKSKKTISNNKEEFSNDLIMELYPSYTKEFGALKKHLEIPTDFFDNTDVLFLLKNTIDNDNPEEPLTFEYEGDNYYTSDKSVCYDKSSNTLQFACKEKGLNVIKKVFIPKESSIFPSTITTIVSYNENGDDIKYNVFNETTTNDRFKYQHITETTFEGKNSYKCLIVNNFDTTLSNYNLYNCDDPTKAWFTASHDFKEIVRLDTLQPEAIKRFNNLFDSYESKELETLIKDDLPKEKTYKLN